MILDYERKILSFLNFQDLKSWNVKQTGNKEKAEQTFINSNWSF